MPRKQFLIGAVFVLVSLALIFFFSQAVGLKPKEAAAATASLFAVFALGCEILAVILRE